MRRYINNSNKLLCITYWFLLNTNNLKVKSITHRIHRKNLVLRIQVL